MASKIKRDRSVMLLELEFVLTPRLSIALQPGKATRHRQTVRVIGYCGAMSQLAFLALTSLLHSLRRSLTYLPGIIHIPGLRRPALPDVFSQIVVATAQVPNLFQIPLFLHLDPIYLHHLAPSNITF
jgi:hypothetical protein